MATTLEIEEFQTEDIMSLNHSRLIQRIGVELEKFDAEYDILPELELELSSGKCKPDICVFPNLPVDWLNDVIYFNQPPIIAIEILSPKQALGELTDKAFKQYFPAGVKVVWLVVPMLRLIHVVFSNGDIKTFANENLVDDITGISLSLSAIFR